MKDHANIEELLWKFYEGETTGAEEETLYRYFETEELPPHLEHYAPLFRFHKTTLHNVVTTPEKETPARPAIKHRLAYPAALAAACLLIIALLFPGPSPALPEEPSNPFEGSYMIVNGVKITDMEILMPEIEKTMALTSSIRQDMEAMAEEVTLQFLMHEHITDNSEF